MPGGHSALAVNREVKMVAAKGQNLLGTSATITGSECSHAQLLGVIKAESQVVAIRDTNTETNRQTQIHKYKRNTNTQRYTRWWHS